MILILVIAFFLLGCSFSCNGMKENFTKSLQSLYSEDQIYFGEDINDERNFKEIKDLKIYDINLKEKQFKLLKKISDGWSDRYY